MVSIAPLSRNSPFLFMEYLCKIHFYRNCTDTVGIFVPPSHFLFFFNAASTITKPKSSSGLSYVLCTCSTKRSALRVQSCWGFCLQIRVFPENRGIQSWIHKGPFLCIKMLEDAKNLGHHHTYSWALSVSKWDRSVHIPYLDNPSEKSQSQSYKSVWC